MHVKIRSERERDDKKITEINDSLIKCKCIAIALVLTWCAAVGSLFPQARSNSNQVTPEFFGVDFWGYSAQLWPQFFTLLDEDTVQFGLIGFGMGWEEIEPEPPVNGEHTYNWSALDNVVGTVVAYGRVFDLELLCRNNWATLVPVSEMDEQCCDMSPPKEDADSDTSQWGMTAYQAWSDFVFNLVERYDGDGVDDAPGITHPAIRYLQLGNEPEARGHFIQYGGTPERYDRMLEAMYNAAKRANPNITVVRGKSNPGPIFDDDSDATTLYTRRGDYLGFISTSLRLGRDHFDIFAINFNDHYTGLFPFVRWLQAEMEMNGYSKPFLVGDARTTAYPREPEGSVTILPPRYPAGFIESLRNPSHPQYEANRRLYHADEARQSLRKLLVALASGQEAISLQPAIGPAFHPRDLWQDAGLIDMRTLQATGDMRQARKPVYYAAEQLMDAVIGADRPVEILDLGPHVYAYRFTKQGDTFYILWHEDPFDVDTQGLLRRGQQMTVDLAPFVSTSQVRIKHFVSTLDTNLTPIYPQDDISFTNNITIDETPVHIQASTSTSIENDGESVPKEFILSQNFPNPFNPTTTIQYAIPRSAHVKLTIYDLMGRKVTKLIDKQQPAGWHEVQWNSMNGKGRFVSSGVYLMRIKTGDFIDEKKILLMK